jgi:threonine dehydratase
VAGRPRATIAAVKTLDLVSLDDVRDAADRLTSVAVRTPLDRSRSLSEAAGGDVFIKCENLQRTGSFKIRGAYNRISRLSDADKAGGVVAASAGNHGQGVALAASLSGAQARVFMPESASLPKVEATKRYGAEVVLTGKDFGAAFAASQDYVAQHGALFVHPFDHSHVIAGQGTIGLEIVDQVGEIGSVVVPIGGGGLISGIAVAVKALSPRARVIGVQAAGAAAFPPSLDKGEPVTLDSITTIADGIAVKSPGALTLAHVSSLVDEVVTVTDDAIAQALVFAAERMKLVLEPAGAVGIAALLEGVAELASPSVVILSGGNIDPLLLLRVIRFGLSASGRYFAFRTRLADRPGELHRLLGLIADKGINILGVDHHRAGVRVHLNEVEVALQVETRGQGHINELVNHLTSNGYVVERL